MRISPVDVLKLDFFDIEYLIDELEEHTKRENEQTTKERDGYEKMKGDVKPPKFEMPKMPYGGSGGFQMPNVSMPSIPKF